MSHLASLKGLLSTATFLIAEGDFEEAQRILDQIADHPERSMLGPDTALGEPRRLHSARLKLAKARGDARAKVALQYHLIPPLDLLLPLFRGDAEGRRARVAASSEPVPSVLHQIWVGSQPPETTTMWRDHAHRHGWDYRLWDEPALAGLAVDHDPVFLQMLARQDLPGAVDVARYHVLRSEGGVYLDCDWVPARDMPFGEVLPMAGLSAIAEDVPRLTGVGSPFLNNSVIAAPPAHPVFEDLLRQLEEVTRRLPKGPAWWVTGPLVFTLACRTGPVTILDAGISTGQIKGGRAEVDTAIATLARSDGPEFLLGWKPWESA